MKVKHLLFLLMLITGLVLWWPVNRRGRRERLTIKWGAAPRKLNYDLHNVLGFYATWVLLFLVVTGLFWGFELVRDIHFGTVLGLPGRLLVFFASLIGASLPVTGVLVWWGKRGRKKIN